MTVESATYISDLQPANPPATDPRAQGDDHLRLIKQVLQNTFGNTTRQFQIPGTRSVSTTGTILKADGEGTLYVSTAGGAVTLTLPTLTAADAGWRVSVIKTSSDANPVFVAPPSGAINSGGVSGLSKARRCIPGIASKAIWDGSAWFITRVLGLPIGACVEFHGTTLPAGYEWPNGQTLSSAANYPEYNVQMGGLLTLDKRGRTGIPMDNMGGSAAGRLPGGIIAGSTFGAVGGTDTVTLSSAQIPAHQHNVYIKDPGHNHTYTYYGTAVHQDGTQAFDVYTGLVTGTTSTSTTGITIGSVSGTANDNQTAANTGGGGSHSNLQPSIMVNQILVVE